MYLEILIVLISLALGSFANNVITHLTGKADFDILVSTCLCGVKKLKFSENVPVLSYFMLKGKCSGCDKAIPGRYFVVEISTVCLAIIFYLLFGLSTNFVYWFMIFFILLLIAFVDYLAFIIPNSLIMILLLIGLISNPSAIVEKIILLISATVLSSLFIVLDKIMFGRKGKSGIGLGDIKLIFVLVLIFNLPITVLGIWIGALAALLTISLFQTFRNNIDMYSKKIPFGAYLVIGIFVSYMSSTYLNIYFETLWGTL